MHPSHPSKPPPSRFRRVTIVIQTILVLALTAMIPIVGSISLYYATSGAPWSEIHQYNCGVDNGQVVLPFATEPPSQEPKPQSLNGRCASQLHDKLYHGEHEISCYASPELKKPVGAPLEMAYILALTFCSVIMLLLIFPFSIRLLYQAVSGGDIETCSPWRTVRGRQLLIALPAFGLFIPAFLSVLQDDLQSFWSKDWIARECVLIEACTGEDAKNDRSGFVFELADGGKTYRSNSYNGYSSSVSIPEDLQGMAIGSPVRCFQNPIFLAQLKIQPSHPPRWDDYLTRIGLLILWVLLARYAINLYIKRGTLSPPE